MPPSPTVRHLIVAFAGRQSPDCHAAIAGLRLPALEALLARLAPAGEDRQDAHSLSPPHERALAAALGMPAGDGRIAWAALEARDMGLPGAAPGEPWGLVTLCHWQVGMNEVVLGDPCELPIEAGESAALLEAARPFFAGDGIALHPSTLPGRWLARGPHFADLATASIDRAASQPIGHRTPLTDTARQLLRLQNEMQMLLYTQRVNDERTAQGLLPINSFWLSGTGALPAALAPPGAARPQLDTHLRIAALRDDGMAWAQAWQALDAGPLADLLAASRRGDKVRLTLCGDRAACGFASAPRTFGTWLRERLHRAGAASILAAL